jgi:Flp pilus assembly protein TadD
VIRVHLARARVQVLPDSMAWTDHLVLAADALGHGDTPAALEHAGAATRVHPQEALGWTIAGEALRTEGRMDEARAAYTRALALDPTDAQARRGLAETAPSGRE